MSDVDEVLRPEDMADAIEAFCAAGEYDDAAMAAALALQAFEEQEVAEATLWARVWRVLAEVSLHRGEPDRAAEQTERAFELLEGVADVEELRVEVLHMRALAAIEQGRIEQGWQLLEEALELLAGAHGGSTIGALCPVLLTMGELSLEMEEGELAKGLFGRALETLGEADEPGSEEHARWLNAIAGKAFLGLGGAAAQLRSKDEARDYLSRATDFLDAAFGAGHPELIDALERVVALYRAIGDERAAAAAEEELVAARTPAPAEEPEEDDEEPPR